MYDQAELDRLYWQTDTSPAKIAAALGVPKTTLSQLATPLPAGVRCYFCREELNFGNRTELRAKEVRCRTCDSRRRARPAWTNDAGAGLPTDDVVLLIDDTAGDRCSRWTVERTLEALERAGFGWDEKRLVRSLSYPPDTSGLVASVLSLGARVVGLSSPDALALTADEFAQAVAHLRSHACRVICGQRFPRWGTAASWEDPQEFVPEPLHLVSWGPR